MTNFPAADLSAEALAASAHIRGKIGSSAIDIALVLGTGLGSLADAVDDAAVFAYSDLPGFPGGAGVTGHAKRLVIGMLEGKRVAMLQGRAHFYEHGQPDAMKVPLETLVALGIDTVFLTNAAGSLQETWAPGSLAIIADHINYAGTNPLIGYQGDRRFVPMTDAYDPALKRKLASAAKAAGIAMPEGVYMWFSGPCFETPTEIRMAQRMGADLVGMSTVPETILARYLGLKVVALSTITNLGAGIGGANPSHAETKDVALTASVSLTKVMRQFLRDL